MKKYTNKIDGVEIPNTNRNAEFVREILEEAISDFPVDDLIQKMINERGEFDEYGYTAIIDGHIYEVTSA